MGNGNVLLSLHCGERELRKKLSEYLGQQAELNNRMAEAMVKMEDRIEALELEVARIKQNRSNDGQ